MARKQRRKAIKEQTPQTPDIKIGTKFGGNEVVSINHNTVTIKNFLGKVYYESMWWLNECSPLSIPLMYKSQK